MTANPRRTYFYRRPVKVDDSLQRHVLFNSKGKKGHNFRNQNLYNILKNRTHVKYASGSKETYPAVKQEGRHLTGTIAKTFTIGISRKASPLGRNLRGTEGTTNMILLQCKKKKRTGCGMNYSAPKTGIVSCTTLILCRLQIFYTI